MLDSFLRHIAKDSYGPVSFKEKTSQPAVVHKFHDAFSVLNWGKMPEPVLDRGRISSLVFASLNQKIQSYESWKFFLKSADSLSFRKGGSSVNQSGNVSSMLNELAQTFPVKTNFLGLINETHFKGLETKHPLTLDQMLPETFLESGAASPMVYPVSEYISEEKIPVSTVMGRAVWDYSIWKNQSSPKRVPFEFLCHFTLTAQSLKKLNIEDISLPKTASLHTLQAGVTWDFPVIELILSQDPFQRRISLSEALWITDWTPEKLQEAMLLAAWSAAFTKFALPKLKLNAIQFRLSVDASGALALCDPFCLDDLYLEHEGHIYHSANTLQFYQKTAWYENVVYAQKHAETFGLSDWKKLCVEPAPWMDPKFKLEIEEEHQWIAKQILGK